MVAYYAHCIADYGTPQEEIDIFTIKELGMMVVNPSDKRYADRWKERGMDYARTLLNKCDVLIFRRLNDGRIPSGVGFEIEVAKVAGMPIIELPWFPAVYMTREETRQHIRENSNWYDK